MSGQGSPGPREHPAGDDVTNRPGQDPDVAAISPAAPAPDPAAGWPGRRTLERGEQAWVGVIAVFLAAYLGFALVTADWTVHPTLASVAALCAAASLVWVVTSARARRPNHSMITGSSLRGLPRPTRRALLRDLKAGRPGPPELRPYAVTWTCQGLQSPWSPATLLALAASNAGIAAGDLDPVEWWRLGLLMATVVLALIATVEWHRRRQAAQRVADALDQPTPALPAFPDPA